MKFKALCIPPLLLAASPLFGFVLEGQSWTLDRTVVMQLSLGNSAILQDGSPSFSQSAQDALNIWNAYLAHVHFAAVLDSPVLAKCGDGEMSALFSLTVFGDSFGTGTLAVTLLSFRDTVLAESDTLFNNAYTWDSYRGPLEPNVIDFRRVAIHEFGHTLGLDHPDQAGQTVTAIMNSRASDIDTVQADDIAGVQSLYDNGPAYQSSVPGPVLANLSTRAYVETGDDVLIGGFIIQGTQPATVVLRAIAFSLSADGFYDALSDPTITVYDSNQRQIAFNDDWAFTGTPAETIASYNLDPPNSRESALYLTLSPGAYTAIVQSFSDAQYPPTTGQALFELYDLHTTGGRAVNLSTRGEVIREALIGGFIVGGTEAKTIIARGLGPSLGEAGVSNPLADPKIELHDGNGTLYQLNDDWQTGPDAAAITAEGLAPTNPKESALLATLGPGPYTVVVSSANGAGVGLVEIYDISAPPSP